MSIVGECALTISGDDIDFFQIEKILGMHASKIINKGKQIVPNKFAPTSIWTYSYRVREETIFEEILKNLLQEIYINRDVIHNLSLIYDIEINCYLRSEWGQFGYVLNQDVIYLMNEIKLPVNFHIISFGLVE